MVSDQAKVTCPHCQVQFGFAVPAKYIANPQKSIKFACAYCKENFAVVVRDLFSNDEAEIRAEKIRHQSAEGLQLYDTWEELMLNNIDHPILDQDPISAFGEEWKPAYMHRELQSLFPLTIEEDSFEQPPLHTKQDPQEDVFFDDEKEDIEDDLFAESSSEDVPWEQTGMSDPFDIPVSDDSSDDTSSKVFTEEIDTGSAVFAEEDELADLIAFGAMEHTFEDSDSMPETVVVDVEDSEDPFLAISDEVVPERGDRSIDALLSSLAEEGSQKATNIGVNTLEMLQSEEVDSEQETPPFSPAESDVAMVYEESEDVSNEPEPSISSQEHQDFENMATVVDGDLQLEESEDTPIKSRFTKEENKDFFLATVTTITEEPSEEDIAQTKTVVSHTDFDIEEANTYEIVPETPQGTSYNPYEPNIWGSEEEKTGESDSIEDFDQTEEEESQSVLNPAFQVSTKKVARRQYFSVGIGFALAVSTVLLLSNYVSLSSIYHWIVPIDEQEILMVQEQQIKKQQDVHAAVQNTVQSETTEHISNSVKNTETIAKVEEKTSVEEKIPPKMVVVVPEKSVYLDDTPLTKQQKKEAAIQKNVQQDLPPMDPTKATREGWIKIEDQSYESAKRIFESVIEQDPNPRAFMGIGYAEERLADRYKERKDLIRVEEQYDAAHKYYCAAMDYYIEKESMTEEERFGFLYVQARLKTISRGCG